MRDVLASAAKRLGCERRNAARRGGLLALLLLLAVCGPGVADAAQRPLVLDAGVERVEPANHLEWLRDAGGRLSLDDVIARQAGFSAFSPGDHPARSRDALWLKLTLQVAQGSHTRPASGDWLIEIAYTQIDEVTFHARRGNEPWRMVHTGDQRHFATRDVAHPNFVFRLPTAAGESTEIYLRVRTATSLAVPVTLWRTDAFQRHNLKTQLARGLYYGLLLALALYNLFLYPTVRDSSYLFYVAYLVSIGGFQFSIEGLAFMYLWPEVPELADRAVTIALSLSYAAGLHFVRRMVCTHEYAPRLDRLMRLFAWLAWLPALLAVPFGPGRYFLLVPLLALAVCLLIFSAIGLAWRRGDRLAPFVLLAYSMLLPGAVLLVLRTLQIIEASFWTEHLLQIGTAVEAVLLSFALAERIRLLRVEKDEAHRQLLAVEQESRRAQQRFSQRLLSTQDSERERLARELHDGVGQHLSLIKNGLWRLRNRDGVAVPDALVDTAGEAVQEIRETAHRLHPHLLDRLGLRDAIESVVERTLGAAGIAYAVEVADCVAGLPAGGKLHLYRIVQEALTNVVRHSGAANASITLTRGEGLKLSISDDGRGVVDPERARGFGLDSIAERARSLGGGVRFESDAGRGFQVTVTVPL